MYGVQAFAVDQFLQDPTDPENDPRYLEYCREVDERVERLGVDLATAPDELECYECSEYDGQAFMRRVVKLGPVIIPADPTQSYVLACGHTVI